MKKINYVTFSSIPSSLPSSLQIIKTCESLSRYNYDVTLIKPGTGNKKISLKKGLIAKGGTTRRCPDISKIKKLGFKSKTTLKNGLKKTVSWYLKN